MNNPTSRQMEALRAVAVFQDEHGYAVTYRELADMIGVSNVSSAYKLLTALERKGLVKIMRGRNRAVTVTGMGRGWLEIDHAKRNARVIGA